MKTIVKSTTTDGHPAKTYMFIFKDNGELVMRVEKYALIPEADLVLSPYDLIVKRHKGRALIKQIFGMKLSTLEKAFFNLGLFS